MKKFNNCNADNKLINTERQSEKNNFHVPIDPSSAAWDRTPDTAAEMVNTYGTYEIQPTADTDFTFPAISQGLPSEDVQHRPEHFHEGIVPELRD